MHDPSPPIGALVPDWSARPRPPHAPIEGRYARLEPLDPARHGAAIHAANCRRPLPSVIGGWASPAKIVGKRRGTTSPGRA